MEVVSKTLVDYVTSTGKCPIRDWLDEIDYALAVRIEARIQRVAHGNFGDAKSVGSGVTELRLMFGSGYRIYFAQRGEAIIVLLCGGDKKSQDHDIEKAINYWLDFKRRQNA
jgi:putative addiction module killer protein